MIATDIGRTFYGHCTKILGDLDEAHRLLLLDSTLASKQITLKPAIELDSLKPTLDLVRQSDWATILPIVAVKHLTDQRVVSS